MTTTDKVLLKSFFKLFEAQLNTTFCDKCKVPFRRTA